MKSLPLVLPLAILLAACGSTQPAASSSAPPAASSAAAPSAKPAASAPASAKPAASAAASAAGAASAKPAASGGAGTRVIMSYSNVDMGHLHEWVAEDDGIFAQNGLTVDDSLVGNSAAAVAALVANQTNFASGSSDVISAVAGGVDLVMLAVEIPVYSYLLEVPAKVKTVADLKGGKVGVDSFGSPADVAVRVTLQKAGLDPEKDVSIVPVGNVPTRAAALMQGAIQATILNPPSSLAAEDKGFHPLINMAQQKLPNSNGATAARRDWVNANKPVVQKYIDSLVLSDQRIRQDKAGTIKIMEKHLKSDDERGMNAAYDFYVNDVYPTAPFPRPEQFKDSVTEIAKRNPAVKDFDVSKILEPSFVQSAVDRGLAKG